MRCVVHNYSLVFPQNAMCSCKTQIPSLQSSSVLISCVSDVSRENQAFCLFAITSSHFLPYPFQNPPRACVCVSTLFYALSVTVSERNKAFHSNQPELYRLFTRGVPYHPVYSSASEIYASNIKFDIVIFQEGGIMTTAALNRHCCGNNF